MNPISRSFRAIVLLLGSYAALTFLYVIPVDHVMMQHRTTSIFYFVFAACIALYFTVRIIEPRVRKNLIGVGAMIILLLIQTLHDKGMNNHAFEFPLSLLLIFM